MARSGHVRRFARPRARHVAGRRVSAPRSPAPRGRFLSPPAVVARAARADRYGLVLILLMLGFLLNAFTTGTVVKVGRLLLFVLTLRLALRTSRVRRPAALAITIIAVVGTVLCGVLALAHRTRLGDGLLDVWVGLVLFVVVLVIVWRVITHEVVTGQTILGALSAYLIIGMMFAAFFGALTELGTADFFVGDAPTNPSTLQYFSFVTLTTLGYGDFTAASNAGRLLAVVEALTGQVFLATLVARLVAGFQPRRRRRAGRQGSPPPGQ